MTLEAALIFLTLAWGGVAVGLVIIEFAFILLVGVKVWLDNLT